MELYDIEWNRTEKLVKKTQGWVKHTWKQLL